MQNGVRMMVKRILVTCGAVLFLVVGIVLAVRSQSPWHRPRAVTSGEREAAFAAARAFYATVRENSLIDMPAAEEFGSGGNVSRTWHGRPILHVSAGLAARVSDGQKEYDIIAMDYDLYSHEIVFFYFSFSENRPLKLPPAPVLDPEQEEQLVGQAKEFALTQANSEYRFDYTRTDRRLGRLEVHFDHVIGDIQYINDVLEVVMTQNGFVHTYVKRQEWTKLSIPNPLPLPRLKARSKKLAAKYAAKRLVTRTGALKEVESSLAAGNPNTSELRRRSWLMGYRRSKPLFSSSWMVQGTDSYGEDCFLLILVVIDANTGRLMYRDGRLCPKEEGPERAKRLL